jgi:hypothetical protein
MVKGKKTLLSPATSLVRRRSSLWGQITGLQNLNIRKLKIMSKTQGLLITEHVMNNATLRAGLVSTKAQLKKLRVHHSTEDM